MYSNAIKCTYMFDTAKPETTRTSKHYLNFQVVKEPSWGRNIKMRTIPGKSSCCVMKKRKGELRCGAGKISCDNDVAFC